MIFGEELHIFGRVLRSKSRREFLIILTAKTPEIYAMNPIFFWDIGVMEVNPKLPEDLHFDDELDHDDGDFVYEYESEVGEDNNTDVEVGEDNNKEPALGEGNDAVLDYGSDSSNDYSSNSDSEHEIQLPLPPRPNRKRGMTRLAKIRTNYTRSGGKKKHVKFDELGRFLGKNRALFVSFLGDIVRQRVGIRVYSWKAVTPELRDKLWEELTRFFDVDESRRKFVMNRMGMLLRNFRRKVYAKYIKPNLGNPTKLAKIPRCYRTLLNDQDDWNNFVTYTLSENFNDVSQRTIEARKHFTYSHRMGRWGYTTLREKLVNTKTINVIKQPPYIFDKNSPRRLQFIHEHPFNHKTQRLPGPYAEKRLPSNKIPKLPSAVNIILVPRQPHNSGLNIGVLDAFNLLIIMSVDP
ncbi:hypothetical protein LXL04_039590 [Taraxacum kok-saghyz]